MTESTTILILALAVIAVIGVLLFRATGRSGGSAKFSVAKIFEAEISISPQVEAKAHEAVAEASNQKGVPPPTEDVLPHPQGGWRLGRVLWVDDNPDWSVYETIALETLGMFVTKATTSKGGAAYLSGLDFDVVISDLGRNDEGPEAGLTFTRLVHQSHPGLPVIIYTVNAERHRSRGLEAGAFAVVDTPAALLAAVSSARVG